MTQGTMGPAEAPTPPRVSTRGSCSIVEPSQYSGQYELLVDGDPPRIVVGRVLEEVQTIHGVPILPHHVRVTIDEVRDLQAQFTRPQKQPIHDTVIHEDGDMAEAEGDPLSKLMIRLPRYMDTIVVDQGRSSMYGFVEPQTIQLSGNTLQCKQHYLQIWMDESKRDVYLVPYIDGSHWQLMVIIPKQCKIIWFCSLHRKMKTDLRTMLQGVIGKSRGQLVQILYPKVSNQQLDSWECGFYVMCWIKTIIRAIITDDWNEEEGRAAFLTLRVPPSGWTTKEGILAASLFVYCLYFD
ncbi:hypothetical protein LR48_Vigan252s003700 [Vigna angularis]|uniref:Ubiquitin-like protease family profile domain-containing protein n=1 Tax=Phaseolus angularis TaxID=3914 RepID=A0A0L9T6U5_PHAAN|nr:hypothetical protein LR48_Vigan252s003700 [Vigna angularis]